MSAASQISELALRWQNSAAAERANYQLFLSEFCDFLEVPRPQPAVANLGKDAYAFERSVHFQNGDGTTSIGRIDLYKRGRLVLEAKRGSSPAQDTQLSCRRIRIKAAVRPSWDGAMEWARGQAEQYARALPVGEGCPPFLSSGARLEPAERKDHGNGGRTPGGSGAISRSSGEFRRARGSLPDAVHFHGVRRRHALLPEDGWNNL